MIVTTVVLIIVNIHGQRTALLDTTSQPNAISELLCLWLRLHAKFECHTEIRFRLIDFDESLKFQVFWKVISDTPFVSFFITEWGSPTRYVLTDFKKN